MQVSDVKIECLSYHWAIYTSEKGGMMATCRLPPYTCAALFCAFTVVVIPKLYETRLSCFGVKAHCAVFVAVS